MARIRTIKPEFFGSEGLSSVSLEAHMLAAGLLCCADDEGYFNAHPKLIQASVFPIRELSASVPELLRELQTISYIDLGQAADGRHYGRVVTFNLHQRISHPTASKIKGLAVDWNVSRVPREDSGFFPEASGIFPEDSAESPQLFRPEGKGKEGNKERKKTSRGKREADKRFSRFVGIVQEYRRRWNPDRRDDLAFDEIDGRQMNLLLVKNPHLDDGRLREYLDNFGNSEVNTNLPPQKWLTDLPDFAGGRIDRYGKPIGGNNGIGNTKTGSTIDAAARVIKKFEDRAIDGAPRDSPSSQPNGPGLLSLSDGLGRVRSA